MGSDSDGNQIVKPKKRENSSSSCSHSADEEIKRKKSKKCDKKKKLKKSGRTDDSSDDEERRKRRKEKKKAKKLKKKMKKEKRKKEEQEEKSKDVDDVEVEVPVTLMAKSMAPMTKEQWEKQQSIVRKVYDEATGRHRLIKGDGEVIEEMVSKDRHKAINQQATKGDGNFFQSNVQSIVKR